MPIPVQFLQKLPKERWASSYSIGCAESGAWVVLKFQLWSGRTAKFTITSSDALHIRDSLQDFIARKNVPSAVATPELAALGKSFIDKQPEILPTDWDGQSGDGQAHGVEIHCYDDAVFLAFVFNSEAAVYSVIRMDPHIVHVMVQQINEAAVVLKDMRPGKTLGTMQ